MDVGDIILNLPYSRPFLFVDQIIYADKEGIEGTYTFNEELDFYKGHFIGKPVTPGVILIETMAQIGMVCLGICLCEGDLSASRNFVLTSADVQFLKPVYPKETVTVISNRIFFRFGKLKCDVLMKNELNQVVCKGILSGMITDGL